MPNHVSQDLYITGPSKDIDEFIEFAKEDNNPLSANKFIPYPKHFADADEAAQKHREKTGDYVSVKDGFNNGGYEWRIQNWGTKWGIYNCLIKSASTSKKNGKVVYTFKSAWTPANLIILEMSKQFPSLTFKNKYYECGMQFKGVLVVKSGFVQQDDQSKYTGKRGG